MDSYSVHLIDVGVAGIVLLSALFALSRGFVREILGIFSWMAALFVALYTHDSTIGFWRDMFENDLVANIAAFGSVFIGMLTSCLIIAHKVAARLRDGALNSLDRTFGFLFGGLRGLVISSLVYMIFAAFGDSRADLPQWLREAKVLPVLEASARTMVSLLPPPMQDDALKTTNLKDGTFKNTELFNRWNGANTSKTKTQPSQSASKPTEKNTIDYPNKDRQKLEELIESIQ